MKMLNWIFLSLFIAIYVTTPSYASDYPKIVTSALETYKRTGFDEAFKIWMNGSPLENDKTSLMNVRGGMTQVETIYGKMIGYELLKSYQISSATIRTYVVLFYEKGPLFMYLDCYKSPKGWIIPELQFHTQAQVILPKELLFNK
ncbi:MAG: hypothetical protein LJE89_11440 [Deltaproteobacteria bacterium]|nr:hypothetical protein [Deltaproteobacteria bacterium]